MGMRIQDLEVAHRWADVNGVRLHYVEKGKGPLVVLLHGFPEMWWSWRHQIDPLVAAGYRVVAPDQRGYNDSEKHGPYDIDTLGRDIAELIRQLGDGAPARLVGHDWGGGVAWHVAATHPEVVDRLVVMNCPHPVMMQRALRSKWSQIRRSWYMFLFLIPRIPEHLLVRKQAQWLTKIFRGMAVDRAHFGADEIAPMLEAMQKPGAAGATVGWYRAAMRKGLFDRNMLAGYPVIHAPTLLVWAKDDAALGYDDLVPGTERWVESLRVEPIERCGHFVQSERPDQVNPRLLAFLAEAKPTVGVAADNSPTA